MFLEMLESLLPDKSREFVLHDGKKLPVWPYVLSGFFWILIFVGLFFLGFL